MSLDSSGKDAPRFDSAVVLAGGGGTRLWPWSGPRLPKPLLPLGGRGRSLLVATLERLAGLVSHDAIFLQAPESVGRLIVDAEPTVSPQQIRTEPSPKDTAAAIALAVRRVARTKPDALVALLPADQRIEDVPAFERAMVCAAEAASGGALAILGITPSEPSTRFGYVEMTEAAGRSDGPIPVRRFVEKPGPERARKFAADGRFVWNAGIFVWRADVFWEALSQHAPEVARPVAAFEAGDEGAWDAVPTTSIDYALMEKAEGVVCVPLDAGWDDVGGWSAVLRIADAGEQIPGFRIVSASGRPDGSRLITAGVDVVPKGVVIGGAPQVVIVGPHGVLAAPVDECDRVKEFLGT